MNLAALGGIDPDDLTPNERLALFGLAVLERERVAIDLAERVFRLQVDLSPAISAALAR